MVAAQADEGGGEPGRSLLESPGLTSGSDTPQQDSKCGDTPPPPPKPPSIPPRGEGPPRPLHVRRAPGRNGATGGAAAAAAGPGGGGGRGRRTDSRGEAAGGAGGRSLGRLAPLPEPAFPAVPRPGSPRLSSSSPRPRRGRHPAACENACFPPAASREGVGGERRAALGRRAALVGSRAALLRLPSGDAEEEPGRAGSGRRAEPLFPSPAGGLSTGARLDGTGRGAAGGSEPPLPPSIRPSELGPAPWFAGYREAARGSGWRPDDCPTSRPEHGGSQTARGCVRSRRSPPPRAPLLPVRA